MTDATVEIRTFGAAEAARVLPRRKPGAHKWGVGGLMVIAGAPGYVGAAALCAMAAGRAGAGIVNLAVNRSLVSGIAPLVPEAGFTILPESDLATSGHRWIEAIETKASRCAAFVIGPGLGEDDYARNLVATLLGIRSASAAPSLGFGIGSSAPPSEHLKSLVDLGKPILVDADGLNALSHFEDWWKDLPDHCLLLTPHVGELSRLLAADAASILAEPQKAALEAARRFRQTVLLKGSPSIVTDGQTLSRSEDAPLGLATAGTGDVLAGSIGAFLAQGLSLLDAANLGLFVGGRSARRIEREYGTLGVIASDLPRAIAREIGELERA